MASNVRHFTLSGHSLKCAEEKTETNKMFSAASRQAYLDAMLLISFILRRTQGCQLWLPEFSCKAGVKISFGVISEVDLWEDAEKKRKETLEEKWKVAEAMLLFCARKWGLTRVRNLKEREAISGLSAGKSVSLSMQPEPFASSQPLPDFFVIHSILAVFAFLPLIIFLSAFKYWQRANTTLKHKCERA